MRLAGTHSAAQVSGIAGLAGATAGAVYGQYAAKIRQVFEQPYPSVTGPRPPDSLIFDDKFAYLRQVLNNADWGGVARWYATMIQQAVNSSQWYDPLNPPPPPPPPAPVATYEPPPPAPVVTMPEAPPIIAPAPAPIVAVAPVRTPTLRTRDVRSGSRLAGLSDLSGLNPKEYWGLSKLNLQDYCDRTFNLQDLHAHTKECILKMCIADYGNKVGFGYAGRMDFINLALFFANGLSHNDGQLDWEKSYTAAKNGTRYGFCLGWVKEPSKHTASNIIVAIGAAFMGAAAWQAISAGAGAASGGVTGASGGAGAGAGAGATAGATATGIETVVVSASAIAPVTAGTVAAGLASGTIAATAAAPAITAPSATIETVVVQAAPVSAVSAGSVAAGVGAGTIAATATAPPIVAPSPVIETVVTEAAPISETPITAGTVAAGVAAGTIAATATAPAITSQPVIETVTVEAPADTIQIDPVEAAVIGTSAIALTQPVINVPEPNLPEIDEGEPSLTDRVVTGLEDAIANFGADWVVSQLERYLQDLLGRPPTQTEIDEWEDWINGGGSTPPPTVSSSPKWVYWLLGAAIAYALYEYSREPKKRRHATH